MGTDDPSTSREQPSLVRSAVLRFLVGSLLALVILGIGTTLVGGFVAQRQALRAATYHADLLAQDVAAPLVNRRVRAGDPVAARRLDAALTNRLRDGSLRHVKLWTADGTIVWSDQAAIVGRRFPLPDDVRELFGTRRVVAELSGLDREENATERAEGQLLEVYVGTRDADGESLVFEAYLATDDLHRDETAIIAGVVVVGLGGLLLFAAAVLPMAVRLARRVERSQKERATMMRHALAASELERRRIAQELHDGVIQDLAGACFALPTVESQLPTHPAGQEARRTLQKVTDLVHRDATALRTMMLEIYPPDLGAEGFATAVTDLADSAKDRGLTVDLDLEERLDIPVTVATLGYRVVREGLRNVAKHADASLVTVSARQVDGRFEVTVTDDGRGVDPSVTVEPDHLGLQLLRDTVSDVGGTVELSGVPGVGTTLHAAIPLGLDSRRPSDRRTRRRVKPSPATL